MTSHAREEEHGRVALLDTRCKRSQPVKKFGAVNVSIEVRSLRTMGFPEIGPTAMFSRRGR
jgi:hypothetical protein